MLTSNLLEMGLSHWYDWNCHNRAKMYSFNISIIHSSELFCIQKPLAKSLQ